MPNLKAPWALAGTVDPCCCGFCHALFGDTLDVVVTGVVSCDCIAGGPDSSYVITGVNGSFTAAWDASSAWTVVVGSITYTQWESGDGTCSGESITASADLTLYITCTGNNHLVVFIGTGSLPPPINALEAFLNSDGLTIDDTMPNQTICGDSGGGLFQVGIDGNVVVSLP